jgi:hypothetical protein
MATKPITEPARPMQAAHTTQAAPGWQRSLAIATAIVFCISSVFPAVAAFVTDTEAWPRWWGMADVGVAVLLAALAFSVIALGHGKVTPQVEQRSYRAYRILIHGIITLLAVFALFGDRIIWSQCLTGIAWRAWLLVYGLPAWLSLGMADSPEPMPRSSSPSWPTASAATNG